MLVDPSKSSKLKESSDEMSGGTICFSFHVDPRANRRSGGSGNRSGLYDRRHQSDVYDWRLYNRRHQSDLYWHRSEHHDWRHPSDPATVRARRLSLQLPLSPQPGSVLSKIDLHRGNNIPRPRDKTPKIAFRSETSAETENAATKRAPIAGHFGNLREISRLGRNACWRSQRRRHPGRAGCHGFRSTG